MTAKEIIDTALDKAIEQVYENKLHNCYGYMCIVATTCYEPNKQKEICCRCIKERYLEGDI